MRTRIVLACSAVFVLCLLALIYLLQVRNDGSHPPVNSVTEQVPADKPQPQDAMQAANVRADSETSVPAPTAVISNAQGSNTAYQQLITEWQLPIDFYGRAVDENSNAVAGATVQFHWPELPTSDGSRTATTQTDSEGLFSLHGKLGPSLTVWVSKQGYYASHGGQQGFSYILGPEQYLADPRSPVIFELRKKGQGAELITSQNGVQSDLTLRPSKNGTPIRVDFLQKKAGTTGQLEITQFKPPWKEATEWSLSISISDGGLIETTDEFQFEAPETKYQTSVQLHFTKEEPSWRTHIKKSYYIVFGKPPRYGRILIETDLGQESIFLTYAINPSGSRNLEPTFGGQ